MTVQSFTLQVSQRGLITLPRSVRKAYDIRAGQEMTLVDLDEVFVLSPRLSRIDLLAEELAQELARRGQNLESMMKARSRLRFSASSY